MTVIKIVPDALTTLERTKAFLGISGDAHDGQVTMAINFVTSFLKKFTKRQLKSTQYTNEVYNGTGQPTLVLRQYPVTALASLQERNTIGNSDAWTTINPENYHYGAEDGIITCVTQDFLKHPERYRVSYTAGYLIDFDNEDNPALHTLPAELEYITHKLVSSIINNIKSEGQSNVRVGDMSVTINQAVFGSSEIKEMLGKYSTPTI